ncbi:FkbM family methyltransferase [Aeropyrum camini]|uniref:FkbM family methyltransferase n=1 Tax=Aeropyrum camini TaxID=229980 RepID=UPI0009E8BB11
MYDYFEITNSSIVFDIGANIGIYTLNVAPKVEKVIAIEPEPSNFELLLNNVILNNLTSKVLPLNIAIGTKDGKTKLYLDNKGGSGTHSIVLKRSSKYLNVPYYKLDTIYKNLKRKSIIDHVDLIKIDVEGAELLVLHGAQNLLKAEHPKLIIAIEHGIVQFKDIYYFIKSKELKYKFTVLNNIVFVHPLYIHNLIKQFYLSFTPR